MIQISNKASKLTVVDTLIGLILLFVFQGIVIAVISGLIVFYWNNIITTFFELRSIEYTQVISLYVFLYLVLLPLKTAYYFWFGK